MSGAPIQPQFSREDETTSSVRCLYAKVIEELKKKQNPNADVTDRNSLKTRIALLKAKAHALEAKIMKELDVLHELHRKEIAILREELKNQNTSFLIEVEAYFRQQTSNLEAITYKYAEMMLNLDETPDEKIETTLKTMLDELGAEAEEVVWGVKKKKLWGRFTGALRR
ncbi:hypothetical protein BDFB_009332, partial [Asbolus verrucosus]